MPIPSPFHDRTSELCTSYKWADWAGYYAVSSYNLPNDSEYYAIRHSAGLIDISPLFKYQITGSGAAENGHGGARRIDESGAEVPIGNEEHLVVG